MQQVLWVLEKNSEILEVNIKLGQTDENVFPFSVHQFGSPPIEYLH